ncbi:MAG: dienelactone hydrolase family protein [Actinomycetota bacterium]
MPLAEYRIEPFTHDGITHDVYHRGDGPCVLVAPEIPGITPTVAEFADRLVDRGFSVAIASLFGTPGKAKTTGAILTTIAKACVSREFHVLATQDSSPATEWLRALARDLHGRHGGPGVGFVGMCFTGGFGLAMLLEDTVIAPVLSQPSLPFGFGGARQASTGLSDEELQTVVDRGCPVLGLRFTGDSLVPGARFATLKEALGDNFLHEEIPSPSETRGAETPKDAHSVLTEHLAPDDQPEHPTQVALARTLDFLAERLELAGA